MSSSLTDQQLMKLSKAEIIALLRDEQAVAREATRKLKANEDEESESTKIAERLVLRNALVSFGLLLKKGLLNPGTGAEQARRPMTHIFAECRNNDQRAWWLTKHFEGDEGRMRECSNFLATLTSKLNGYAHPVAHHTGRELEPDLVFQMIMDTATDEHVEPATGVPQDLRHILHGIGEQGNE